MNIKQFAIGISTVALFIVAAPSLPAFGQVQANLPSASDVQDARVKTAMDLLESMAKKLGSPKIQGTDLVAGDQVPAIYFGSTKINNNFDLVDDVVKQAQGTATIFVKNGDKYVRVATNVKKADGSRALGTLTPTVRQLSPSKRTKRFMEKWTSSVSLTLQATSRYWMHRKM